MFVRLSTNPMNVKKTNAVRATPSSVDDKGDEAALGYDYFHEQSTNSCHYDQTHCNNPPSRSYIGDSSSNQKHELVALSLVHEPLAFLAQFLDHKQAGQSFHDDEQGTKAGQCSSPPIRSNREV